MMAFDILPTHTHQSALRSAAAPAPRRDGAAETQRGPNGRRAGVISAIVAAITLGALGFGSAALADATPDITAPQHEQLHHARTGCLTPECPADQTR